MEQDDLNDINKDIETYRASKSKLNYGSAAKKRIQVHTFYSPDVPDQDSFTTSIKIVKWMDDMIEDVDRDVFISNNGWPWNIN